MTSEGEMTEDETPAHRTKMAPARPGTTVIAEAPTPKPKPKPQTRGTKLQRESAATPDEETSK